MSCPHSNAPGSSPETCSQCHMDAKVKVVKYDPETRQLLVDGKIEERSLDAEKKSPPNYGTIGPSRRATTCGICGVVGHTRATCGKN